MLLVPSGYWCILYREFSCFPCLILAGFTNKLRLKRVRLLSLKVNSLTQVPSLDKLSSLNALYFIGNFLENLSGLEGLGTLTSLEELNANNNEFVGSIPPCLYSMTSLYALDLHSNNFGGNIPSSLFPNLKSLEYVSLSWNAFEGSFSLAALSNNSRLQAFDLTSNYHHLNIMTENPPYAPSAQLKVFRLSGCTLNEPHGVIPSFQLGQHDLQHLGLENNNMRGDFLSRLLENNTELEVLRRWQQLGTLKLSENNLKVPMLPRNANLTDLVSLSLDNNQFTGEISPGLLNSSGLQFLDIVWGTSAVDGFVLKADSTFAEGKQLRRSYPSRVVSELKFISKRRLESYRGNILEYMSGLDLSCNNLSGSIPQQIGYLNDLRMLNLSNDHLMGLIPSTFSRLKQMESLDLSYNWINGEKHPS
ncbi:hypothetical protein CRG98_031392 [Punica granatum]|uniref:Uncharacterized protein n=1 Tax=Punica granatum TaxID=22663 RepID=A0A2I0IW53_PUNGR|nr:hypothetical protein CRG98_031392 [Punica granatum]